MPKVTVCKGCGNRMMAVDAETGKPACIICGGEDNSLPVEMDCPDELRCGYKNCGSRAKWNEEKKVWILTLDSQGGWNQTYDGNREIGLNDLPFLDAKEGTFYCGCRGWD